MNADEAPTGVFIKTFGCQMNEYDSFRILKMLEAHGYAHVKTYDSADLILLNTCTVRQKAEDKAYSELGRLKKIKLKNSRLIIGVGGCLAQQEGERIIKRFPYVDLVFGTHAFDRLPHLIKQVEKGNKVIDIAFKERPYMYPLRTYTPDRKRISAFVTIMQGCNNFCSYCIVPYVRGREFSRPPNEIVDEIMCLADTGVKEVTLLGQNVNSYGNTFPLPISFSELLFSINAIEGIERIRFVTSHPKDLSRELIQAVKSLEKVCEHIHLPLQSGSDTILKKMNRGYTREQYRDKIDMMRSHVPGIAVTSDIIVGFPGETDDDFMQTYNLVKEICFDDLFIFHYTDRTGTKASRLNGTISYETKINRLRILNEMQRDISLANNKKLVGKDVSVLFEGKSKRGTETMAGRTRSNLVVNCTGPVGLLGKTVQVKIKKANIHSLTGCLEQ